MDMEILAAVVISIPLIVYLWAGWIAPSEWEKVEDYFIHLQRLDPGEFANTSVAYGLQIATISLFLAWGYLHPLPAIVNAAAWGLGIGIFARYCPQLSDFFGSGRSLHGYLGSEYNSPFLRSVTSFVSILGFIGLMLVELVWGSRVLISLGLSPDLMYIVTFGFAIFILAYLSQGGHSSVTLTDQFQLLFSYIGLFSALLFILYLIYEESSADASGLVIFGILLAVLAYIGYWSISRSVSSRERKSILRRIIQVVLVIVGVTALVGVFLGLPKADSIGQAVGELQLFKQGVSDIGIVAIILLPLVWQFVDVTQWQRMSAVEKREEMSDENDTDIQSQRTTGIKRGLWRYAIESPVTWILAILIGIGLRYTGVEFSQEEVGALMVSFPEELIGMGILPAVIAGLFCLAIISIMLSTVDSSLMGATFTFVYDLYPQTRRDIDTLIGSELPNTRENPQRENSPNDQIDNSARKVAGSRQTGKIIQQGINAATLFIFIGLVAYYLFNELIGHVASFLFTVYGAQVALFPAVFGTLVLPLRHRPKSSWVSASVIFGVLAAVCSFIATFYVEGLAYSSPVFGVGISGLVYLAGIAFSGN